MMSLVATFRILPPLRVNNTSHSVPGVRSRIVPEFEIKMDRAIDHLQKANYAHESRIRQAEELLKKMQDVVVQVDPYAFATGSDVLWPVPTCTSLDRRVSRGAGCLATDQDPGALWALGDLASWCGSHSDSSY